MSDPRASPALLPAGLFAGGRTILAAQVVRLLVRLGSAAALARLLTPEAYGLHGMAATVYGLLYMTRDFGIVTAIQQPDFTPQRFNALCRLGLVGGGALAVFGVALGPPTGWFYGETGLVPWVLAGMCSGFVFAGAAAPALGLLYREQKAGMVAVVEVSAMATASVAAVAAAWAGWGVWALVLMAVLNEVVLCLAAWRMCSWRPGRDITGTRWRTLLGFGANLTGHSVANYGTRMLDQITVGRTAGAAALGFYGRGAQITALPMQFGIGPFTPWIVATLSHLRNAPEEYARFFRRSLNGLLHVSLAAAAVCLAVPEVVVMVLFGRNWLPAVPVVRWLGFVLALQPWLFGPIWLFESTGQVRRLLVWSSLGLGLVAVACFASYRSGPAAIAAGVAAAALVQAGLGLAICAGRTPAVARDWLQPTLVPLLVHGGLAVLLAGGEQMALSGLPTAAQLSALVVIAVAYYAVVALVFPRARAEIRGHFLWHR